MFLSREIDIKLCQNYTKIQIGFVFVEYDLFIPTTSIQQYIFMNFRIDLTRFYINFSRQEHQIDVLYVLSYTPFHFSFTAPLSATNDFPEKLVSMKFNESCTRLLSRDFNTDQN